MMTGRGRYGFIFILGLILVAWGLAACTPGELEPGSDGAVPVSREPAATATADAPPTFESPTATLPGPTQTATQTDLGAPSMTPTPPATLLPPVTPTPVPPFPGFRYETAEGIWQVNDDWQPELLVNRTDITLSPDGSQALYIEEGHIWLLDIAGGDRLNLTGESGRYHCCAQWWPGSPGMPGGPGTPGRPGTILFGSWPSAEDLGPSSGYLSVVQTDGSGYAVLSEGESNALPDGSPDGQRIAYDRGGTAWIYDYETDSSTQLDPADYGVDNVQRIAGPSWSPEGRRIAWTIAATNPEWRISVLVIDLVADTAELYHTYENIGRGGWFPGPAWHPDGEWLAFVAEDVNPELFGVWVVNTLSGEEVFIGRGQNPVWSPDGHWLAYTGFESGEGMESTTHLLEVGSWYPINLYIPESGRLLDWVLPG